MIRTPLILAALAAFGAGCGAAPAPTPVSAPSEAMVKAPPFWTTAAELDLACEAQLVKAKAARDALVSARPSGEAALQGLNAVHSALAGALPMAGLYANVHPDESVREAGDRCEQKLSKFASELELDREVYEVISALKPDALALSGMAHAGLSLESARFLERTLRDYRRAGVDKDDATRARLAALKDEMVKADQAFAKVIRDDKRFVEYTAADLVGLPKDFLDAHPAGPDGKIKVSTDYPDFYPLVQYATKEETRKAMYIQYLARAYPENDANLKRLLTLRHEYATLLGYPNWAAYNTADKMVKTADVVVAFIDKVSDLARPIMQTELAELLARKRQDVPTAEKIWEWDRFYYADRIRAERFGVDAQAIRAYFDYEGVRDGVFQVNQALFGVKFVKVEAPVWHESVEAYDVLENDQVVARFYLDMHPREGKYNHAAMFPMMIGENGKVLPMAALVTNFPLPKSKGGGQMEHGDVTTFFHEFGHLMHHLLGGRHDYVNLSGITCEWDFVEVPSQLMEEWAWDPKVLAGFSRHAETGAPISAELVEKMRKAEDFGKGIHVMRQMFYAAMSQWYHDKDPATFELMDAIKALQDRYNPYPHQEGTYIFANFGHLGGYSSVYYTYMWSLSLAKDFYSRFEKAGMMDSATAKAYRETILNPGGAMDANDMARAFLGREPSFDAFKAYLERR